MLNTMDADILRKPGPKGSLILFIFMEYADFSTTVFPFLLRDFAKYYDKEVETWRFQTLVGVWSFSGVFSLLQMPQNH